MNQMFDNASFFYKDIEITTTQTYLKQIAINKKIGISKLGARVNGKCLLYKNIKIA